MIYMINDIFFVIIFIFIASNDIIYFQTATLVYLDIFTKSSASGCC